MATKRKAPPPADPLDAFVGELISVLGMKPGPNPKTPPIGAKDDAPVYIRAWLDALLKSHEAGDRLYESLAPADRRRLSRFMNLDAIAADLRDAMLERVQDHPDEVAAALDAARAWVAKHEPKEGAA